ncbi:uracil-DNA glycosylase [Clostridium sp. MT-14]|jgi:DNA polymerase|uniref:Uracil-DNA glycosylase n=1 Tax=Clostridium aromativorans TaxID=2836848 RepID=A0ABS8NA78_9CLOT|nr:MULTISPECIES: uracil-DNA glycosylase [Clostridium]KAA8666753.1 uracil-DNA glycosylase [Clostridium sp. HV4-5-A1G]MCC9296730.1 uracil-DNA glycosylase [Clostridium aromativorans]CAB1254489.1 Uracil DNA glycosylase superfamily protein [Clostridiaceae bacterium BL-3]
MNDIEERLRKKIKEICDNYKESPIGGYISGDGPIPCDVLFVGEAPGKTEVERGKPFVGMAGKTFEKYLNLINLERKMVRITNSCFFRPIKIKEGKNGRKTVSNRTPKISEIKLFKDILNKEIELVNPRIIITLGNTPLKIFTEFNSIGECHGNIYFNEQLKKHIFPMYHPSALTYNRNSNFESTYKNDWLKLKNALNNL